MARGQAASKGKDEVDTPPSVRPLIFYTKEKLFHTCLHCGISVTRDFRENTRGHLSYKEYTKSILPPYPLRSDVIVENSVSFFLFFFFT